jgi:hypothetical protein
MLGLQQEKLERNGIIIKTKMQTINAIHLLKTLTKRSRYMLRNADRRILQSMNTKDAVVHMPSRRGQRKAARFIW